MQGINVKDISQVTTISLLLGLNASNKFVKIKPSDIVTVDPALSATSANPVQNKTVTAALNLKAPLDSPAFTGTPTAPTINYSVAGSTRIATTAYVKNVLGNSPTLGGSPTVSTAPEGTNNTRIANTAFVEARVAKAVLETQTPIFPKVVTVIGDASWSKDGEVFIFSGATINLTIPSTFSLEAGTGIRAKLICVTGDNTLQINASYKGGTKGVQYTVGAFQKVVFDVLLVQNVSDWKLYVWNASWSEYLEA